MWAPNELASPWRRWRLAYRDPVITLIADDENFFAALEGIVEAENVAQLVVGFPRGLQGNTPPKLRPLRHLPSSSESISRCPLHFQDEALTSKHAEAELRARGKLYDKGDIDALAATYILEDWLAEHRELVV